MKIVNYIVRVLSVLSVISSIILFVFYGKDEGQILGSTFPVIFSSIVIFLVTFLPSFLAKKKILITNTLYLIILISTLLSMGGGYVLMFYVRLNYFDTFIHFMNGTIIVFGLFVVIHYFVEDPDKHVLAIILISVLASMSLGTLWEIFEFLADLIIPGSNMQRFENVRTGEAFSGQAALLDTMIDLIVDTLGAILGGTILYMDAIRKKLIINSIVFQNIEE